MNRCLGEMSKSYNQEYCCDLANYKEDPNTLWIRWLREQEIKRDLEPVVVYPANSNLHKCQCLPCNDNFNEIDMGCGCIAGKCACSVCLVPGKYQQGKVCTCGCSRSTVGTIKYIPTNGTEVCNGCSDQPCLCSLPFPKCEVEEGEEEGEECEGCEFCIENALLHVKY